MTKIFSIILFALFVSGCVSLGMSQQQSEQAYTDAAIAGDLTILSGDIPPKAIGQICFGDNSAYSILISTRNIDDGVKSYAPADNAHAKLQSDGSKINPQSCIPPS